MMMNMLRRSASVMGLLLFFGWVAPAWAQSPAPAVACPPAVQAPDAARLESLRASAQDRGMLWRLDKGGRSSWLYGTIHLGRMDWVIPGPTVMAAIGASDTVALELDLQDASIAQALMQVDAAASARVLDASRRERIGRAADGGCLPREAIGSLRPFVQVLTLAMMAGRWDGLYPELAVDAVLTGLARGAGKRVVALETAAQQMAALAPATETEERELVDQGLRDLESGAMRTVMGRMAQIWARGDDAALASYPAWCQCMDTPAEQALYRKLNDDRNPAMADKLAALHEGGARVFGAVGALHMTGAQALPDLLRARGFTVQRVTFQRPATD